MRYGRSAVADGRIDRPDVADAIQIKIAMLLGGGYPIRERRLSTEIRRRVLTRDGGICQLCREAPATQVDHIDGSSADERNLRGVCDPCHRERTKSTFRPATDEEKLVKEEILRRIFAPEPLRVCDDHTNWSGQWRAMEKARRKTTL